MKNNGSMNRAYRVVWNTSVGAWQAVAESGRCRGKSKSSRAVRKIKLALLSASVAGASAFAAGPLSPIDVNQPFYLSSGLGTTVSPVFVGGVLKVDATGDITQNFTIDATPNATIDQNGNQSNFTGALSDAAPGIAGAITISNSGGGGSVTFSGANTYSGGTTIGNGATLGVSSDSNLGDASSNLIFDGGTLQNTASFSSNRNVTLNAGGGTFNTDPNTTLTLNGSVAGSGDLAKDGDGMLVLTGTNTYTGNTKLNRGILQVSSDSNLGDAGSNLIFDGGTLQNTASFTSNRNVTLNAGGGTFNTDPNTTLTLNGSVAGSGDLAKDGDGMLVLTGTNTYTGNTKLNRGILQVSSDSNLGDASSNLIFDGGTLQNTASFSSNRNVTLNAGGGTFNTDPNTTLTLNGSVAGSGDLAKDGDGMLVLTGTNTYTGNTKLNRGILQVSSDSNLGDAGSNLIFDGGTLQNTASFTSNRNVTLNAGGGTFNTDPNTTLTLNGSVAGSGDLAKDGDGMLVLTGTNTYTGNTKLNRGILQVSSDSNLGDASSNLIFDGGTLQNTASFTSNRNVTLNAGGGTFNTDPNTALTLNGSVAGSGSLAKNGAGTLVLAGANTYTGNTQLNEGVLQVRTNANLGNASSNLIFDGGTLQNTASFTSNRNVTLNAGGGTFNTDPNTTLTLNGSVAGSGDLAKDGDGMLVLTGTNTYTGNTKLNRGILQVSSDSNLGDASSNLIFDGGTLQNTASFTSNRNVTLNAGGGTFNTDPNTALTLNGSVAGSGSLAKNGAGTLVLAGTNSYTGNTQLNEGVLQVSTNANLGDAGSNLIFDGGTLQNTASFTSNRNVTLNAGGGTFNTDPNTALTLNGSVAGSGSLAKNGAGTLVLAGTNSYTGNTQLNEGVLQVSTNANLGNAGSNLIFDGGTLQNTASFTSNHNVTLNAGGGTFNTDPNTALTLNGSVAGSGSLAKNGAGTLVLAGTNSYTGNTQLNEGVLQVSTNANLGNAGSNLIFDGGTLQNTASFTSNRNVTLNAGGGTFNTDPNTTLTLNGSVAGSGDLAKDGDGMLVLTGTNTYTGNTKLNRGILQVSSDSNLGDASSNLIFDGGTLQNTASFTSNRNVTLNAGGGTFNTDPNTTLTLNGSVAGSGDLAKDGDGMLVLTGTNTYTGNTKLNRGILQVSSDSNLGDASSNLIFDGGTLQNTASFTSNRNVTLNAGGGTFNTDPNTALTLNGSVAGSGSLAKNGAGTLVLAGTNSYTGNTQLNEGVLQVSTNANLGNAGSNLIFDGGTLQNTASFTSNHNVTLNAGGGTFNTDPNTALTLNGSVAGSGDLAKDGDGMLVLTGTNTYTGNTKLNRGILQVSSDSNLGDASSNLIFDGGTLQNTASFTSNRNVTLNAGGGTFNTDPNTTLTLNGSVAGSGSLAKNGAGTLVLNGVASNSSGITINDGTLVLSAINSYSGGTTLNGGSLKVRADENLGNVGSNLIFNGGTLQNTASFTSNRNVTLNAGGGTFNTDPNTALTLNGSVAGSGSLAKNGAGTLVLNGVASNSGGITINDGALVLSAINSYTGDTTLNGGSLKVRADENLGNVGSNLIFNGGTLQNTASFTSNRNVTLNAGGGTFNTDPNTTLTLNGSVAGSGSLAKNGAGTLVLNGVASNSSGITINDGTLVLSAINSYTGDTTLNGGSLKVRADENLGNAGSNLIFNGGTLQNTASFSSNRNVTLNAGGGTFNTDPNTALTLNGSVAGSGSLAKNGTGTLVLAGANSYTGNTQLNEGVLQVSTNTNLGDAGSNLIFNGGTLQNTASFTSNRNVTLNAGGGTFNTDPNTTLTLNGSVAGSGSLAKNGAGTLVLAGTNSYTGNTQLNEGVLQVSTNANLGNAGSNLIFNGGTLQNTASFSSNRNVTLNAGGGTFNTDPNTALTLNGSVAGSGSLAKNGAGTLVLAGANSYTGNTQLNEGVLQVSTNANLGNAGSNLIFNGGTLQNTASFTSNRNVTLNAGGGTFNTDPNTALTLNGSVAGSGSFAKNGAGTLVLAGANSYTGNTQLNEGVLQVSTNANLGNAGSNLIFNGGTLQNTASFTSNRNVTLNAGGGTFNTDPNTALTLNGSVAGSGSFAKNGAGTLVLAGANSYTGNTQLNEGVLQVSTNANLGNAGSNLIFNGGTLQNTASFTSNRNVTLNAGGATFNTDPNTALTLNGTVAGSGSLAKNGAGTLVLAGANTYTGNTQLNEGVLQVSTNANLGNAGSNLIFNGGTLQNTASFTSNRNVTLNAGGGTFNTDPNTTLTLNGSVAGSGSLAKNGAGTLVLAGANSYTGNTQLNEGVLQVSTNANLGNAGSNLIFNGGTLQNTASFSSNRNVTLNAGGGTFNTDPNTALTLNGSVAGSGSLVKNGNGTLVLGNDNAGDPAHTLGNSWTGGMTINAGLVRVSSPLSLGPGNITINGGTLNSTANLRIDQTIAMAGGTTIDTDSGTTTTLAGSIVSALPASGSSCVIKSGQGTLDITGAASVANGTCVQEGTLRVNGTLTGNVTLNPGALLSGAGNIRGTVDIRGSLSPGNSVGFLATSATTTMLTGSSFEEDIAGTKQASVATPVGVPGYYSLLNITGGGQFVINADATLAPKLKNIFDPSEAGFNSPSFTPTIGDTYRIVTADGGLVGRFTTLTQPDGMAAGTRFAAFYNVFGSNSIDLKVVPSSYSDWLGDRNGNTRSAANALDRILAADQAGAGTAAQDQLLYLTAGKSATELPRFVTALAGEVHGALAAVEPLAGQWLQGAVARQLSGVKGGWSGNEPGTQAAGDPAVWGDIASNHVAWKADGIASAFSGRRTQLAIGANILSRGEDRLGIGISHANTNVSAAIGSGSIGETMAFGYGQLDYGDWLVDGMAGYGTSTTESQRPDPIANGGTFKSSPHGRNSLANVGLRAPMHVGNDVIEPFARLMWQESRRHAFTESGATTALSLADHSANGVRALVGVSNSSKRNDPLTEPHTYRFSIALGRDSEKLAHPSVQASLAGTDMTIAAPQVGKAFIQADMFGTTRLNRRSYVYLGLTGEARSGKSDIGVNAGLRMSF